MTRRNDVWKKETASIASCIKVTVYYQKLLAERRRMAFSSLVLLPLLTLTLVSSTHAQCRVEEQYDIVLSNITKPARVLAKYNHLETPYDCMFACCQKMKESCNTASFLFYKGRPVCLLLECHPGHCFWGEYQEAVAAVVEDVSQRTREQGQTTGRYNETGVTESFATSSPTTTSTNTTTSPAATAAANTSASTDEKGLHTNSTTTAVDGLTDGNNATSPLTSSPSLSDTTWPTTRTSSPSTSSASTFATKSQKDAIERLFGDEESRESNEEDSSLSSSSSSSSEEDDDFVSNMLNDMYGSDSEEWYHGETDREEQKENQVLEQEEQKETAPPDTALASENDVENVPEEVDVPEPNGGGSKPPYGKSWAKGSMGDADYWNMPALALASAAATLIIAGIIILAIKKRAVRDRSQYRRLREEQDALVNYQDE